MQHVGERLESGFSLPVLHHPATRRGAKKPPPANKWPTASNVVVHTASMRINRTGIEDSGHYQRASAATKEPVKVLPSHFETLFGAPRGRRSPRHVALWRIQDACENCQGVFCHVTPQLKKLNLNKIW